MIAARVLFEGLEGRILLDTVPLQTVTHGPTLEESAPGVNYTAGQGGNFAIPKFDDMNGARTLRSVQLSITLNSWEGTHAFDNETAAPANVDLSIGSEVNTFTFAGGNFNLTALANRTGSAVVPADDDGFPPVPSGDEFYLSGPALGTTPDTQTASDTLIAPGDNLNPFTISGSGSALPLPCNFLSALNADLTVDVGNFVSGVNPQPQFNFVWTIVYTYVPEPSLEIVKGVIGSSHDAQYTPVATGPVSFDGPGTTGVRFSDVIHSINLGDDPVDSNALLLGPSIGDLVSFGVTIENVGGNVLGAFDVRLTDTIPQGLAIPSGGPNLVITDGAGNVINYQKVNAGFAGSDAEALFLDPAGIELIDPLDVGGTDGAIGPYNPNNPRTGDNIAVLTYDLVIVGDIRGDTLINTATITNYNGNNTGLAADNLATADLWDQAEITSLVYAYDVYDTGGWFARAGTIFEELEMRAIAYQPIYSGTAEPGSTLTVSIYNSKGLLIGAESTVADAGGNWMTSFFKTVMMDEPHSVVIRQSYGGPTSMEDAGYNFRAYFTPVIQGGLFISEHLTVENVIGKREAANAVDSLYTAGVSPITLGWHAYSFEFLTAPATASGI